jgi:hypothetical protein
VLGEVVGDDRRQRDVPDRPRCRALDERPAVAGELLADVGVG